MKAYAIFDGGGVKGAAFAGCLDAAEDNAIEFMGYGGTSAGSIIALLAFAGYSGQEIREITVKELEFSSFLDDSGSFLERLRGISFPSLNSFNLTKSPDWIQGLWAYLRMSLRLRKYLGLYESDLICDFLAEKVWKKFPALTGRKDFTFGEIALEKHASCGRWVPLKIVASDLVSRTPVVFSDGETHDVLVLEAVRASMSYPFVFRPVRIKDRFLVDGGLSINLPIHIFQTERRNRRMPIIAFDLIDVRPTVQPVYKIKNYVGDMINTALSSSQHLLHTTLAGIYQVPIEIPSDIRTLDFQLTEARKEDLYNIGYAATAKFFNTRFPQIKAARNAVETLQAQYVAPRFINPVLEAIALDFERNTKAQSVRCSVMMAYDQENKIVAYQYGMDYDSDVNLTLPIEGGCSGLAWKNRQIVFADLEEAKASFATDYGMTQEDQNRIPAERVALLSVPIFDYSGSVGEVDEESLPILGVLSIDTTTKLEETEWTAAAQSWAVEKSKQWATVISRVLS